MTPARLIRRKRDGGVLDPADMRALMQAYAAGDVADYQMAAFLMAVYYQGLDAAELDALVDVMLRSGEVLDLSDLPGRKVDKHSTGGVGDKVSILLAPLVASLGVIVPMMSGRGLGHSGGTVDKLESIPGFRMDHTPAEARAQLERIGCVMTRQTEHIAPLDRRLYALRDVTATVESIPLISSSIMSKKLAEGIDGLVLDVKVGNGAFIPEPDRARELARTMIGIGRARGCEVVALLTAMDRPLGHAVGNALEVEESIAALRGEGPADLMEVTYALAAEMLVLGGRAGDLDEARRDAEAAVADGRALDRLRVLIEAQGGNPFVVDDPAVLPQPPVEVVVTAERDGVVASMDVRAIGDAAVALGAGRRRVEDAIDPAVGFHITAKPGQTLVRGEPWATVYARDDASVETARRALAAAVRIGDAVEPVLPLIFERVV